MCGIGGIFSTGASADSLRERLSAMEAAMVHRGPDDGGIELLDGNPGLVGLCARRLAIQDLSPSGHQPMHSPRSGSWICLNGEIYNAQDLRTELLAAGYAFRGHSDTEVVAAAYDHWGSACFHRLRGMFAVAVWDQPGGRLILARDRLGIKPLYYADRPGELLFASETRALLASGLVPATVSAAGVASYLSLGAIEEPATILEGVRVVPPGHVGVWDGRTLRLTAYWSLADQFARSDPCSRVEAVARLRELLEDAVRRHLVSDVPIGVFLSGGIDSSTLVGLVATVSEQPPQTVSVVLPQQRYSEERYIRLVAERFGTRHVQVVLDDVEAVTKLPAALAAMDQPTFDGVNTYVVSGQARAAGLTVALAGVGGDELLAGYDTFRTVTQLHRARRLLPKAGRPLAAAVARLAMRDSDRTRKLTRWLAGEPGLTAPGLVRELFAPLVVTGLLDDTRADTTYLQPGIDDDTNLVSYLELDRYMRNVLLRDGDVLSMAHGLEVRVPFLDHRVVELVAGLPGGLKAKGATPKPLLVEAVADLLPAEVVHRRKMGFTLPFAVWLRGVLREQVEASLLDPGFGGPVGDLLDHAAVQQVWQQFLHGRTDWTRPWSLYVLKVWAETRLPSPTRRAVP